MPYFYTYVSSVFGQASPCSRQQLHLALMLTPAATTTEGVFGHGQAARSREPLFQVPLLLTQSNLPPQTRIFEDVPVARVWHRGCVHRQRQGLRDTQADFLGFAWGPGGAAAMFRGYPCFLASSCTRWMAFLIPWQGIQNAVAPHLSHPGKLHSLYVPPGAVFLPGCFQQQWLSDPEKGASPVCPQTHIPDVTPQSLTIRPVDQRAQNNLEEVPWKDSQLIIS